MKKVLVGLTLLALAGITVHTVRASDAKKAAAAGAASTTATAQNWYVIESKHTGPECLKALDDMSAKNVLGKTYWGCMAGDHRGWSIIQAQNTESALKMLPESQQASAKAVQVTQFTAADLQAIHASKKG